jgi:UDP-3-O-[3-hydroxymyristoyl] glucosamine N-acyltransferase
MKTLFTVPKQYNPKQYNRSMKLSLTKIAKLVDGEIVGDPDKNICSAAPFESATEDQITFAQSQKLIKKIDKTQAGAVLVPDLCKGEKTLIVVKDPKVAFVKVMQQLYPPVKPENNVSSSAHIGNNLVCGGNVSIAPFVVVSDNVTIGDRVMLHPGVFLGDNVKIGNDVVIWPNVTIYDRCRIGNRVIIHAGTVIGSDGFGFVPEGDIYHKMPQTGIVQIDDDVEIGPLNAIDRATFGKTRIKKGVKTDNLVHIAHNVTVGENSVLAGQVGVAGSTSIGKHCVFAGQAGIGDHVSLGDNVTIGPKSGVLQDVPDNTIGSGIPIMPHRIWLRVQRMLPRLPELKKMITDIEKRLSKIEKKPD